VQRHCEASRAGRARRRIRITYLITDLNVGGVPLHLYRLATGLDRNRFHVRVISLADRGPVGEMLAEAGIEVFACEARSVWNVVVLARLWLELWRDPPDVLHAYLFHANTAARLVGPLAGVPVRRIICEIQTVERERSWHLTVDKLTSRCCRYEVGNSSSVVEHLHRYAGIPMTRLRQMAGGVDVEAFASAQPIDREQLQVPADTPLVIWTGRLDPVKGFEEMLAAFRQVAASSAAHLILAGDGPYRPAVERLIREYRLGDRVRLLRQRGDIPALLKAADLFLFCSRTEGLPNSLLEAMAAGLPIVATDVPGSRDLIETGRTGLLVPARSVPDIAEAVQSLLEKNKDRAEILARNAQQHVWQNFSLAAMSSRWTKYYEILCHEPQLA